MQDYDDLPHEITTIKAHHMLCLLSYRLKDLDVKALKTLSRKVNVIPLIAKADTMTAEERSSFKNVLLRDLDEHHIRTFPSSYPDEVDGAEELLVTTFVKNRPDLQLISYEVFT